MHFSTSKSILELAFISLKNTGLLYFGNQYYSELKKNILKDFLKNEWYWNKIDAIYAIKVWRDEGLLELQNDCLIFKFTEVIKQSNALTVSQIGNVKLSLNEVLHE
jgi:hypothetical protein